MEITTRPRCVCNKQDGYLFYSGKWICGFCYLKILEVDRKIKEDKLNYIIELQKLEEEDGKSENTRN